MLCDSGLTRLCFHRQNTSRGWRWVGRGVRNLRGRRWLHLQKRAKSFWGVVCCVFRFVLSFIKSLLVSVLIFEYRILCESQIRVSKGFLWRGGNRGGGRKILEGGSFCPWVVVSRWLIFRFETFLKYNTHFTIHVKPSSLGSMLQSTSHLNVVCSTHVLLWVALSLSLVFREFLGCIRTHSG